ncbi:putative DNA binding domain-containing protein [bacterium]|nr:putative DNA binding domain-containing protein [bacterium]
MDYSELLKNLAAMPRETEWAEFKVNNDRPETIAENISAIANSTALLGREWGYVVWGVDNETHALVGTSFRPHGEKVGNEALENWLLRLVFPQPAVVFREFDHDGKHFVVLEIRAAKHTPVRFKSEDFIRVGSYTKKLKDHPEKERELWRKLGQYEYESEVASEGVSRTEVERLLSFETYFKLLGQPVPSIERMIELFLKEDVIRWRLDNTYDITNLGAILFAHDLGAFGQLARKAIRVIEYKGTGRTETKQESEDSRGYAVSFVNLITRLRLQLPSNEVIENALRKQVPIYPEIALRELVANELIHQDFSVRGSGPMIEIFSDRIEFTNPGESLVDPIRIIDAPPQSRNDRLASLMRRLNVCEERGSGIDKVITSVELFQLPAPKFEKVNGFTRSTLYAPIPFKSMDKSDRIRACYQHACLMYVTNQKTTNASVRQRFGLDDGGVSTATRIIGDTYEANLIKPKTDDAGGVSRRYAEYLPFWA